MAVEKKTLRDDIYWRWKMHFKILKFFDKYKDYFTFLFMIKILIERLDRQELDWFLKVTWKYQKVYNVLLSYRNRSLRNILGSKADDKYNKSIAEIAKVLGKESGRFFIYIGKLLKAMDDTEYKEFRRFLATLYANVDKRKNLASEDFTKFFIHYKMLKTLGIDVIYGYYKFCELLENVMEVLSQEEFKTFLMKIKEKEKNLDNSLIDRLINSDEDIRKILSKLEPDKVRDFLELLIDVLNSLDTQEFKAFLNLIEKDRTFCILDSQNKYYHLLKVAQLGIQLREAKHWKSFNYLVSITPREDLFRYFWLSKDGMTEQDIMVKIIFLIEIKRFFYKEKNDNRNHNYLYFIERARKFYRLKVEGKDINNRKYQIQADNIERIADTFIKKTVEAIKFEEDFDTILHVAEKFLYVYPVVSLYNLLQSSNDMHLPLNFLGILKRLGNGKLEFQTVLNSMDKILMLLMLDRISVGNIEKEYDAYLYSIWKYVKEFYYMLAAFWKISPKDNPGKYSVRWRMHYKVLKKIGEDGYFALTVMITKTLNIMDFRNFRDFLKLSAKAQLELQNIKTGMRLDLDDSNVRGTLKNFFNQEEYANFLSLSRTVWKSLGKDNYIKFAEYNGLIRKTLDDEEYAEFIRYAMDNNYTLRKHCRELLSQGEKNYTERAEFVLETLLPGKGKRIFEKIRDVVLDECRKYQN